MQQAPDMIKPFKMTDLGYFMPNKFSNPDVVLDQISDEAYEVETLWYNGMAAAILIFRNYWGRNWMGCFLIADDFNPKLAVVLKDHIRDTMIKKDALRLQTESVACKVLDDWHEFLGFKWEGTREKMLFDQDYNMWALMRGGN